MTIQDLGSLGELIAAVATVGTLIYLAVQIRRNTAATMSSAHQTQVDSTVGIQASIANDPDLADLITKAGDDLESLTPGQNLRLLYFYACHFNLWHAAYCNRRNGLLAEHAWIPWENGMRKIMTNQIACRYVWDGMGDMYDEEFTAHVNKMIDSITNSAGDNAIWGGARDSNPTDPVEAS